MYTNNRASKYCKDLFKHYHLFYLHSKVVEASPCLDAIPSPCPDAFPSKHPPEDIQPHQKLFQKLFHNLFQISRNG